MGLVVWRSGLRLHTVYIVKHPGTNQRLSDDYRVFGHPTNDHIVHRAST